MNSFRFASRVLAPRIVGRRSVSELTRSAPASSLSALQKPAISNTNATSCLQLPEQQQHHRSLSTQTTPSIDELGSVDHGYTDDRIDHVAEPERRAFTYLLLSGVRFAYASTARVLVVKFVSSMSASADVLAMASAEFDLSEIALGKTITVKWRGKPVFIRHRTPEEIATEVAVPLGHLRDQESDEERAINPEWLIVLGICTHLGCVPLGNAGEYAGWFCPCHGSHYDTSGRIRKGPAPLNMEVPPYKFLDDTTVLVG